jgi:hypothetical protein
MLPKEIEDTTDFYDTLSRIKLRMADLVQAVDNDAKSLASEDKTMVTHILKAHALQKASPFYSMKDAAHVCVYFANNKQCSRDVRICAHTLLLHFTYLDAIETKIKAIDDAREAAAASRNN